MEAWERRDRPVDRVLRSALVVEPSPNVQRNILAAVLRASRPAVLPIVQPAASSAPARTISPLAYVLLAAVLLAYAGALSWVEGYAGDSTLWLDTLVRQIVVTASLVGASWSSEPLALAQTVLEAAPWIVLLPVAWLLWVRDRATAEAR